MKVIIQAEQTTLTPSLRNYLEEKLVRPLEKFLARDESAVLDISIEHTTNHHKKGEEIWRAEANVTCSGTLIRGEKSASDAHEAIDLLEDEIVREVKNFQDKRRTVERRGARTIKGLLRRFRK